jgi:hypothetical protein
MAEGNRDRREDRNEAERKVTVHVFIKLITDDIDEMECKLEKMKDRLYELQRMV